MSDRTAIPYRPALFSGPMVRAIQDGRKTQTRRVVQHPFAKSAKRVLGPYSDGGFDFILSDDTGTILPCPYGPVGTRLWVRETWTPAPPDDGTWGYMTWAGERIGQIAGVPDRFRIPKHCIYASDWTGHALRWTPAIHMPRWASRITLEVTEIRVERLQDINEADAEAEGADRECIPDEAGTEDYSTGYFPPRSYINGFQRIWGSINGPGSWELNPWVWVVGFRKVMS